jgi:hypothetical protein
MATSLAAAPLLAHEAMTADRVIVASDDVIGLLISNPSIHCGNKLRIR